MNIDALLARAAESDRDPERYWIAYCSDCSAVIPFDFHRNNFWFRHKHADHYQPCHGHIRKVHEIIRTQRRLEEALLDRVCDDTDDWPLIRYYPLPVAP